jgi:ribosomal subunit interface protein
MDVNIQGRNVGITDRFQNYVLSKSDKVEGLSQKAQSFEVRVSRLSDRSPQNGDRVELTLVGPGPVIRAESEGVDKYTAFDIAYGRLLERVRRAHDKKNDRRGRRRISVGEAAATDFSDVDVTPASLDLIEAVQTGSIPVITDEQTEPEPYSPVVIRSKEFAAEHLTIEDAVDRMELVGHDFFLFIETETNRPSVVYRRKGWDYGVIALTDAKAE